MKFEDLKRRVTDTQRKYFSWQERLTRALSTPSLEQVFGTAGGIRLSFGEAFGIRMAH